ncbi:hypothetical protein [Sediminimonas sp.]|uniref:hypothetical protein n=1 Tax=Sediminimonas sp. TaxID=2823379 RepID=UPI0025FE1269|nr:hypothetical protein [Sediminimonas sp.]
MKRIAKGVLALWLMAAAVPAQAQTLQENNARMLRQMQQERGLSDAVMKRVREIFAGSRYIGQGNPAVTRHPMTPADVKAKLGQDPTRYYRNALFERICGARFMAPLYDPQTERPEDAEVCVDMFEYPNVPGMYPVTWVRASEAARLCAAEGKRIGDAHEWEGASAGRLLAPDYFFGRSHGGARAAHNQKYAPTGVTASARNGAAASAPPAVPRAPVATAAVLPAAGRTPTRRAVSLSAAARWGSMTLTETRPST